MLDFGLPPWCRGESHQFRLDLGYMFMRADSGESPHSRSGFEASAQGKMQIDAVGDPSVPYLNHIRLKAGPSRACGAPYTLA
jgi:hypothetical protein